MPTPIILDIDRAQLPRDLMDRAAWTFATMRLRVACVECRRTRRGWHVTFTVARRLNAYTVVALQAILGSDARRETFNLIRVRNLPHVPPFWRSRWNVKYRPLTGDSQECRS